MPISHFFDGGCSVPRKGGILNSLYMLWGYFLAARHRGVHLTWPCLIHPEARINPRGGKLTIGARSKIAPHACIQGSVTIGKNCSVNIYSVIVGNKNGGFITIGDGVRIAPHVMMFANNHVFADTNIPIHQQGVKSAPIIIEDDVWIAGSVNIGAGVRIGRGSVIGAGAVVMNDIPPWSVAVGVPAKVIKSRKPQATKKGSE